MSFLLITKYPSVFRETFNNLAGHFPEILQGNYIEHLTLFELEIGILAKTESLKMVDLTKYTNLLHISIDNYHF